MPQFSIIIPVYNVQNHLAACLKSVAEQPGPRDWECLLIDDGSPALTGTNCDALAAELPGLQVHRRALVGAKILHPAVLSCANRRPLPVGLRLGRGLAL